MLLARFDTRPPEAAAGPATSYRGECTRQTETDRHRDRERERERGRGRVVRGNGGGDA